MGPRQLGADTLQKREEILGDEHPEILVSRRGVAIDLFLQGRQNEALALDLGVFDARRRTLGDHHPDSRQSAQDLASDLRALGRDAEAGALDAWATDSEDEPLAGR